MNRKSINLIFSVPELAEILESEPFMEMKKYPHHGRVSCYEHSVHVAAAAYRIAKRRGLDYISAAKGGLLHDFYLYDRYRVDAANHRQAHPVIALDNAEKYFEINEIVRDSILNHMWPVTPRRPAYPESRIVSRADKRYALMDYGRSAGFNITEIRARFKKIMAAV